MITEIVTFRISDRMNREDVLALFEKSVPVWKANPNLVHKSFLYDQESGLGGGVYLWKSLAAAQAAHGDEFCARIEAVFGDAPEFRYFDSPIVINNHANAEKAAA